MPGGVNIKTDRRQFYIRSDYSKHAVRLLDDRYRIEETDTIKIILKFEEIRFGDKIKIPFKEISNIILVNVDTITIETTSGRSYTFLNLDPTAFDAQRR